MNRFVWIITMAVLLLVAGTVKAGEIYQYTDKDGNLIFTDDMSKVPDDQISAVQTYDAFDLDPSPSTSESDVEEVTTAPAGDFPDESVEGSGEDAGTQADDTMFETAPEEQAEGTASGKKEQMTPETDATPAELEAKNKELEQTLDKLRAEQNRLTTQSPETMRGEKLESYQKKVNDLNKRIRRYKVELNRFQRQVASFNNRIKRLQLKEKEKEQQSGL